MYPVYKQPSYHRLLDGDTDEVVFNNGVVGGRRDVFASALAKVRSRIEHNWAASAPFIGGGDMVVWNEVLRNESEVVTGYPFGPVNLPMWGGLTQAHTDPATGRFCAGACRHRWLNATRGLFWFTHKTPPTWFPVSSTVWPPACLAARPTEASQAPAMTLARRAYRVCLPGESPSACASRHESQAAVF